MRGAIMQPYFFPYIGYYQLAYAAEKFIFLDDVNYIKKGYINRNSILLNGNKFDFSVPVEKVSQNRKINEHNYINNFSDFLLLIENAYKKMPQFNQVMPLIEEIVLDENLNVAQKNSRSLSAVFRYLDLHREFIFSSDIDQAHKDKGQTRILTLCKKTNIDQYRNAIGGQSLYEAKAFENENIELKFTKSNTSKYDQGSQEFIGNLSIIDVLMHCEKSTVIKLFEDYTLIN